ncbi:MAG: FKBP-type peptidyl-prolyl cis-trans isomerase [Myxococcota bacterium]|nr:FKBP-type peptidyl-prolyl cis-trans isomerase [Myxococcota bacterium]
MNPHPAVLRRPFLWIATLGLLLGVLTPGPAATADAPGAKRPRFQRVAAPDGIGIRRYNKTEGEQPGPKDRVTVHYHGTLEDGTVFDSSVDRGRPASFRLDGVIPCWTKGLTRLRVGEKAQLTCPPATAYGLRGSPPRIPPNATLVFEVEIIGVE